MIIKINNKEYLLDGYVNPLNSIQNLAEEVYQQGRTDAFMEIAYSDSVEKEPFEVLAYQKGRADAIDELLNNISESIIWDVLVEIMKRNIDANDGADKIIDYLQKVAEQLKEQKAEVE